MSLIITFLLLRPHPPSPQLLHEDLPFGLRLIRFAFCRFADIKLPCRRVVRPPLSLLFMDPSAADCVFFRFSSMACHLRKD